ncbi:MAG: leucyl aminopeptidase [Microbacteriaceae bacterium]
MSSPRLSLSNQSLATLEVDVIVIGATTGKDGPVLLADSSLSHLLGHLKSLGFTGRADELIRLPALEGMSATIAVMGIGPSVNVDSLRRAAGSAARQLAGASSIGFACGLDAPDEVYAIAEGASLASYAFTAYRSKTSGKVKNPVSTIVISTQSASTAIDLRRLSAIDKSTRIVRDLINTPGRDLFPDALASAATDAAQGTAVTVEVWDENRLVAEGCGGIVGVGQGSSRPPRLVKLSYSPEGATQHVALVGKGITYDTGGYSLKPAEAMSGMHSDMGGAATVLGLMLAAAEVGLTVRLTGWLCIAENMVSSTAIRPNDVLTIRGGTTVEVLNTDAEGRLVMADGLVLASEENPDAIIDIATLTGAAIVALGRRTVGVMGDDTLVRHITQAGTSTGEPHWAMPLPEELRSLLDSRFADIANVKLGNRDGGMLVAATFLQEFVGTATGTAEKIPWAHLDIAGAAINEGPAYGHIGEGATGVSIRTLLTAIESYTK